MCAIRTHAPKKALPLELGPLLGIKLEVAEQQLEQRSIRSRRSQATAVKNNDALGSMTHNARLGFVMFSTKRGTNESPFLEHYKN